MPIVRTQTTLPITDLAVTGAMYAQIVTTQEEGWWGVRRDQPGYYFDHPIIFTKPERDMILRGLAEAQLEIEQNCGFPLAPRWIADDDIRYRYPAHATWGKIIEAGIEATTDIELDATVNHATDPATVIVTTTITDEEEIRIYYPASLNVEGPVEIDPSDIDIGSPIAGQATIYIPRCRLVHPDYVNNPTDGWSYNNLTYFLTIVDVKRVYNDPSINADLVWPHADSCAGVPGCTCPTCSEYTRTGCIYLRNAELGIVDVLPANYTAGAWSRTGTSCCTEPERMSLNYRAGMNPTTTQAQDAIIRLAHSKMPEEPCGHPKVLTAWKRDRAVPEPITRERLNCPYGLNEGAWIAWRFTQALRNVKMSTM